MNDTTTAVATQKKTPPIKKLMENPLTLQKFHEVMGKNAQSFVTSVLQVVSSNDLLAKAEPVTVFGAALTAATMQLPINPNLGFAYIVPFQNRKKGITEAQFQMGWKGFVQLAQRSGQFKTINATEVYANQLGEVDYMTGETQILNVKPEGKVVGYIAYFSLLNGFEKSLYMDRERMTDHAKKYSQSFKKGYGVWADGEDGFNAMAKKTVLKLLLSQYGMLSIEIQNAVRADQAVLTDHDSIDLEYPDNEDPTPEDKKESLRNTQAENESEPPNMP